MGLFDQRSFSLIPNRVRRWILALLVLATLVSIAAMAWLLAMGARDSIIAAVAEVFRASAIGSALWFFFLMGQKAQSRRDLLELTSQVLRDEIPASIRSYAQQDMRKMGRSASLTDAELSEFVRIDITHVQGTTHAHYRIEWFGIAQTMHIQLNVRLMSLIYYFPEDMHDHIEKTFADSRAGAESSGWSMRNNGVQRETHIRQSERFAELAARRNLKGDFLHDPTERLFISNDIAAMTRSMMISWSRYNDRTRLQADAK